MNHGNQVKKLHMEPRMESGRSNRLKTAAIGTLHTCVILVLAVVCALWMAEDVFSEITLSAEALTQVLLMLLPMVILVGIVAEYWRRMRLLLRYLVPMVYFGALIYYGFHHAEDLLKGLHYLSAPVLQAVNSYYKTNFMIYGGGYLYAETTLEFILLCVSVFFLTEALWCGRRILLLVFPVLVLACEMAVGKTPQPRSTALLFVMVLLCGMGSWENGEHPMERKVHLSIAQRAVSLLVPVCVLAASLLIGGIALRVPAAQIVEYGPTVRQFEWDMEEKLENWFSTLLAGAQRDNWYDVTNLSPNYNDREILHATFSELPLTNQYLRGNYGTYYENGQWVSDEEAFDELWESKFPGKGIASYASYQRGMYDDVFLTLRLDYVNFNTTTVYVPFTLDRSSLADGILLTGEYRVTKSAGIDTVTYEFRDVDSAIWYVGLVTTNAFAEGATASWYNSYVEDTYLEVPDSLAVAGEIADELLDLMGYEELDTESVEMNNDLKCCLATVVTDYMANWTYSLELSGVPDGTDVVAYFLTESHTGYCVHYATAATMILREMGVPARYASGYLCKIDQAVENENGEYEVSILDSDAHAWVEIYLEGIGWYPIEVTPSAGQTSASTATWPDLSGDSNPEDPESEETESTEDRSQQEDSESETGQNQTESERADSDGTEQDVAVTDRNSTGSGFGENGTSGSGSEAGMISTILQILKTVAIVVGILLLVAAIVTLVVTLCVILPRRREQMQLARIRRNIKAGRNRRAIYGVHRMINRKLRRKTYVAARQTTDREYAKLLEKHFPQDEPFVWEKYVEIVQKCVFSKEDITEEEAQYCEQMLRAIHSA